MLGSVPIHKVLLQHGKVSASTLALSSEGWSFVLYFFVRTQACPCGASHALHCTGVLTKFFAAGFVLEGGSQKISVSWASVSAVDWSHAPLKPTCQLVLEFRKKEKLGGEVGSHYMLLELGVPAISLSTHARCLFLFTITHRPQSLHVNAVECVLQADERLKSMAEQGANQLIQLCVVIC
jgi:hypothetical protein